MDDQNTPGETADQAAAVIDQTHEQVKKATDDAATTARERVERSADAAEAAVGQATETARTVSSDTADAFGAARERLNSMTSAVFGGASSPILDQFRANSSAIGEKMGGGYQRATEGMAEFNAKAIQAWRANAEATISYWQSLASVKTLSEMVALNTQHTRQQMEALSAQTRELTDLAGKIAHQTADSLKPSH